MVPKGTILYLDGRANSVDYNNIWEKLSPLPRAIYLIGDYNCHQKYNRSFVLNDNQLPFCARDIGIFFGFVISSLASIYIKTDNLNLWTMFMSVFPNKIKKFTKERNADKQFSILFGLLMLLPLVIDGFAQAFMSYESTNIIRFFTGVLFGFIIIYSLVCYITFSMLEIQKLKRKNKK